MTHHRIVIRGLAGLALAGFTLAAQAECGGQQQCMAVSIDPAVAPAHGTPETTAPLTFGNAPSGSISSTRPVLVGAVTGPAGSLATLNAITIVGAHAGDFEISSQTCVVGTPSLVADGATCTLNVAFKPTNLGPRTAELKVSTSAITRTVPLTGTGLPAASPATMSVPSGGSNTLNLAGSIGPAGQALTVEITTAPQSGTVTLSGSVVTYQARADFSGADSFSYLVRGNSGAVSLASSPATVSVTVLDRASGPSALSAEMTVRGTNATTLDLKDKIGPSGESLVLNVSASPQRGSVSVNGTKVIYQPAGEFIGTDSFSYTVTGSSGVSSPATVTVQRLAPLTAQVATLTAKAATPTQLDLSPFIGPPGESLTIQISSPPQHGTATVNGTRVTYTSTGTYVGPDAFSYTVTGLGGASPPATVAVSVEARPSPANDAAVQAALRAQAQTSQRFARAQLSNVQTRLGALRRLPSGPTVAAAPRLAEAADHLPTLPLGRHGAVLASARTQPLSEARADVDPQSPAAAALMPWVLGLAQAAQTGSLRLDMAQRGAEGSGVSTGVWLSGQTQFGNRARDSGLRFKTDGVTLGIDRRFSDSLVLGVSGGYAKDRSEIGASNSATPAPSGTRAVGNSLSLYGLYQPGDHLFLEAMVGAGRLDLDIDRFVAASGATARGSRQGDQWFGSLAIGYQFRLAAAVLSPFARLDAARTRLDEYAETGAGLDSLTYLEQSLPSHQVALGLSAQSRHSADIGWITPRARLEWRHELRREGSASLYYSDLPGNVYQVAASGDRRDTLVLGLGSELQLRNGLRLGADFQTQRLGGRDADQTLRLWLSQALGGPGVPPPSTVGEQWFTDPVRVEAFFTTDDNLNRAGDPIEKRSDRSYSLNVSKGTEIRLGSNSRLLASAFGAADKFSRYAGLDRVSLGVQARAEYRASSAFTDPIMGVQARLSYDDHPGNLRTGSQGSVSLTYRQSVTDRIEGFATVARRVRQGESPVFDERDVSALVQIDYTISPTSMVYVVAERRKGDLVSTVPQAPAYASFARASAADDAYGGPGLFAYRYEAKTTVWTLGFNRPIGPRDSVDISVRRAASTPTAPPSPLYGEPPSYATTQFSLAYLLRF